MCPDPRTDSIGIINDDETEWKNLDWCMRHILIIPAGNRHWDGENGNARELKDGVEYETPVELPH